MLKFGQIVDLDLIERSAPNKYVQVRRRSGEFFGVTMVPGVKVSRCGATNGMMSCGLILLMATRNPGRKPPDMYESL